MASLSCIRRDPEHFGNASSVSVSTKENGIEKSTLGHSGAQKIIENENSFFSDFQLFASVSISPRNSNDPSEFLSLSLS